MLVEHLVLIEVPSLVGGEAPYRYKVPVCSGSNHTMNPDQVHLIAKQTLAEDVADHDEDLYNQFLNKSVVVGMVVNTDRSKTFIVDRSDIQEVNEEDETNLYFNRRSRF